MKPLLPFILISIIIMSLKPKKIISVNGINKIKKLEGLRLVVYNDEGMNKTAGYGHLVTKSDNLLLGETISENQAGKFLKRDLMKAENTVNSLVNVPLNQNQYDALVSLVFNIGYKHFKNSTMLIKLNDYNYSGALAEFKQWVYVTIKNKKIISAGLSHRRYSESDLFNT